MKKETFHLGYHVQSEPYSRYLPSRCGKQIPWANMHQWPTDLPTDNPNVKLCQTCLKSWNKIFNSKEKL